jgi:hypothetical protein
MKGIAVRVAVAVALIGFGWSVGRAQSGQPDFELMIDAPGGATTVQCVRGCSLQFHMDSSNSDNIPSSTFSFNCRGVASRCSSGTINGYLKRE